MTLQVQDITIGSILHRLLVVLRNEGMPEMTLGDFYDDARKATPGFDPKRTIMLDDGSQGWYIAARLAPMELVAGDSMRMFATHMRGYVNLDIALAEKADESQIDDAAILAANVRPEVAGGAKTYARIGVEFIKNGKHVSLEVPSKFIEIDIKTGAITPCSF